ncbi:hypothetical protein YC2023_091294 [Brassica napus]
MNNISNMIRDLVSLPEAVMVLFASIMFRTSSISSIPPVDGVDLFPRLITRNKPSQWMSSCGLPYSKKHGIWVDFTYSLCGLVNEMLSSTLTRYII